MKISRWLHFDTASGLLQWISILMGKSCKRGPSCHPALDISKGLGRVSPERSPMPVLLACIALGMFDRRLLLAIKHSQTFDDEVVDTCREGDCLRHRRRKKDFWKDEKIQIDPPAHL